MQPQFHARVRSLTSSPIRSEVGHDLPTRPFLEELLRLGQFYTSTIFRGQNPKNALASTTVPAPLSNDLPLIKAFKPEDVTSSQPVTFK